MPIERLAPHSSGWITHRLDNGSSVDLFLCRGASLKPLVLVVAGVHGDEYEGPTAVARLAAGLRPQEMAGSLVVVPVANPMAFAAGTRTTPEDGMNLARTFPGNPTGTPTERLAYWLFECLGRRADYLVDLHSGGVAYRFLPLCGFYGAADSTNPSYCAARHFGLPVLWQLPETTGVLSHELSKLGVTAIGCEYLGSGRLSEEGAIAYVDGVLSCLALWGVAPREKPKAESGEVVAGDWQLAAAAGMFEARRELGCQIEPGDPVAEIVDVRGRVVQRFVAPYKGIVLALRSKVYIREGEWGVLVAQYA